jgi:hypothetical protein
MTPQQAVDGIVELALPDGGHVLVSFGEDVSGDPDLESDVLLAMLGGGDSEVDVCRAVAAHAEAIGLRAVVSDESHPVTVVIEASTPDAF